MGKEVRLRDIGERRIIDIIKSIVDTGQNIGDDCAALDIGNEWLLATTDVVTEEMHMPGIATPYQIGWYAAAVNLSDIAAMGGKPIGLLTAFMAPEDFSIENIKEIARGLKECTGKHDCTVIGGDTKQAPHFAISGTALGVVAKDRILRRSGARVGDILAVTGSLGRAAAGMKVIEEGIDDYPELVKVLLEPQPRVKEGEVLAGISGVHACIDISDGLATSIHQLGKASGVGFEVDSNAIPVCKGVEEVAACFAIDTLELTAYYGGDFELLLAMDSDAFTNARMELEGIGTPLAAIGKAVDKGFHWVRGIPNSSYSWKRCFQRLAGENKIEVPDRGWEHFR